jgi:hypothetical protein
VGASAGGLTAAERIAARKAKADAEEAQEAARKRATVEAQVAAFAAAQQSTAGLGASAAGLGLGAQPELPQQPQDEEDALDAFMAAEILPEVKARQEAEKKVGCHGQRCVDLAVD